MTTNAESPSLSNLLRTAIGFELSTIHTSIPGRVESYNSSTQKASVKPLVKKKYKDGVVESLPVIVNVPIMFPRTSNSIISLPISKGDLVLIVFMERSIDQWLSSNGSDSLPGSNRKFDMSDAVAIPGLYPFGLSSDALPNSLLVKNGNMRVEINNSDKIAIGNNQEELLDLIEQILVGIEAITITHEGVHPINNIATFSLIRTALGTIKGSLT